MITTTTPTTQNPGAAAEALTGRDYLSWSQLNTFRSCPQAYAFKYVHQAPPAFVSSALVFGGAVHSAIQHHFERRLAGDPATVDDLVEAYRLAWHERVAELGETPVRYGTGEDADTLTATARALLECFRFPGAESELAEPAGHVIAIEETLRGQLAEDLPALLAIIDLAYVVDDGPERGLHVIDFKTSRSRWSAAKVAEAQEQLRLYRVLAGALVEEGTPVHLEFGVLVKTKTPTAQRLVVAQPAEPVGGTLQEALAACVRPVWRAIELGVDYPAPSALGCAGCPYRAQCPAHRLAV